MQRRLVLGYSHNMGEPKSLTQKQKKLLRESARPLIASSRCTGSESIISTSPSFYPLFPVLSTCHTKTLYPRSRAHFPPDNIRPFSRLPWRNHIRGHPLFFSLSFPVDIKKEYMFLTKTVDEDTCNPLRLWHNMGEPKSLTQKQNRLPLCLADGF